MSALAHILGLVPGDRVLLIGAGDAELEASLEQCVGGAIDRSAGGTDVGAGLYRAVAVSRAALLDRKRRVNLLAAASRALDGKGTLIADVPNRLAWLSRPVMAFEGLADVDTDSASGSTFMGCRRLVRRADLERVSRFLCLPSVADPRIMLPLDSGAALSSHYRKPYFVESIKRRVLRRVLAFVARIGLLSWVSPRFTLIATRGAPR